MDNKTIKLIAFIVLLVHGVGHFQGVVASFGVKINNSGSGVSWLLKGLSDQMNNRIGLVLFLLTGMLGICSALGLKGLLLPYSAWQNLALITAFLSTICLVVFPNNFAMFFNKIGAVIVNLIIFYSILLNNQWPSALFND